MVRSTFPANQCRNLNVRQFCASRNRTQIEHVRLCIRSVFPRIVWTLSRVLIVWRRRGRRQDHDDWMLAARDRSSWQLLIGAFLLGTMLTSTSVHVYAEPSAHSTRRISSPWNFLTGGKGLCASNLAWTCCRSTWGTRHPCCH